MKQCKSANPSGFHAVTPVENLIYFMKEVKKTQSSHYISFPYSFIDQMHESPHFYPTSLGFHFKRDWQTGDNRWWRPVTSHFWSWQAGVECFANVRAQETEMPDPQRWLHWALQSSYTVQPPTSDCCLWRSSCLAGATRGGAGVTPNGPGLLIMRQ